MKKSLVLLLGFTLLSCAKPHIENSEPIVIFVSGTPPVGVCKGEYLLISFLENKEGKVKAIWAHSVSSVPGKYKVHYSKRIYTTSNDECTHIDEVLMHSEQYVEKEFYGGNKYILKSNFYGKVVIKKI